MVKIKQDSDKVNTMIKEIGIQCHQYTNSKPLTGLFDVIQADQIIYGHQRLIYSDRSRQVSADCEIPNNANIKKLNQILKTNETIKKMFD